MNPIVFEHEATHEYLEAIRFYEECREGLGRRFRLSVEHAVRAIRSTPERWAFFEPPVRSLRVPKFPYRLLYVHEPNRVVIVAVMHLHRRPGYWQER